MKDFLTLKPQLLFVTTLIFVVLWSLAVVASDEAPPPLPEQADTAQPSLATPPVTVSAPSAPQALPTKEKNTVFPWWGIGLVSVVLVALTLYFILANMARKTAMEFETTIIDDIVTAIKPEYAGLQGEELRRLVAAIVADHRCTDGRFGDLLRIEYEVEKTDPSNVKRTTAVALKRQGNIILKKATRTLAWEDLPGQIRKEFILKNEKSLVYSLYSTDEKKV